MQRQPSEMGCECKYGMKASLGQQLLASVAVMPSSKAVRRVGRRAGGEPGSAITNSPPLYHERDGDSCACPHAGDIANTPRAGLRSFKVPTTLPPERGLKPLEMQSNPHHSHQTRNASNDGSAEFSNSRSTAEAAESEGGVKENHETPMVCLPTVDFPEVEYTNTVMVPASSLNPRIHIRNGPGGGLHSRGNSLLPRLHFPSSAASISGPNHTGRTRNSRGEGSSFINWLIFISMPR